MIRNYVLIAWRNIRLNKMFAVINVAGLALAMTCCLFIFLWVRDEKSIDNFHRNGKNIFAVYQTITAGGKKEGSYSTPLKIITGQNYPSFLLENMQAAIPEVKYQAYYATGYELPWGHAETFQLGEKKIKLEGARAGEDFFKIFSYPLLEGNANNILQKQNGIAISRKMAVLFFGDPHNAVGKTLRYENKTDFMVSGVFENLPVESSFRFDFLFNWEAQKKGLEWSSNDFKAYVQLADKAVVANTEIKINRFLQARLEKNAAVNIQLGLQRFGDQYLQSHFENGKPSGGRIAYVRIFSGLAIFILIIACINFMNLATAQSAKRAKEVGLRKVIGSSRANLIGQFLGESIIFSFIAMLLSAGLVYLLLPTFNHFTGKEIASPLLKPVFWLTAFAFVCITGIIAGSYPALYLSSLKPVRVLKGVVHFTTAALWFRKGLTVFQFILSIILIIATIVITRQTNYIQNTNLGYDRENLIYARMEGTLTKQNNYQLFKQLAMKMPGIAMVDRSSEAPHAMDFVVTDAVDWQGKDKNANIGFKPSSVGYDFLQLMNLKLASGRGFSREIPTDSADAFMINEAAVKQMGLKDPIGKWISAWSKKGHIIGILKDYHTHSLREPIKPVVVDVKEYENFGVLIIRSKPGETKQALASLAKLYKEINPNFPFSYQFVDEEYRKLYSNERIISSLSVLFAVLAIVISCLGLFGLVMFAAEQRVREIGVRKVLGASVGQIFTLLSKDFLRLVIIAFLIAAPVSWYAMNQWLQHFAYKIGLSWWIFALAAVASVVIALLTVSYQAVRAAVANPVHSLRAE